MDEDPIYAAARARAAGWLEAFRGDDAPAAVQFRYLVAMVAERAGLLVRVGEERRGAHRVVLLADPLRGQTHAVTDPDLGGAEAALVDGTEWVVFGGVDPLAAPSAAADAPPTTGAAPRAPQTARPARRAALSRHRTGRPRRRRARGAR